MGGEKQGRGEKMKKRARYWLVLLFFKLLIDQSLVEEAVGVCDDGKMCDVCCCEYGRGEDKRGRARYWFPLPFLNPLSVSRWRRKLLECVAMQGCVVRVAVCMGGERVVGRR